MPQSCPYCCTQLPMVVDAFCPECREDLSETREEAEESRFTWDNAEEVIEGPRFALSLIVLTIAMVASISAFGFALAQKNVKGTVFAAIGVALVGWSLHLAYKRVVASTKSPRVGIVRKG